MKYLIRATSGWSREQHKIDNVLGCIDLDPTEKQINVLHIIIHSLNTIIIELLYEINAKSLNSIHWHCLHWNIRYTLYSKISGFPKLFESFPLSLNANGKLKCQRPDGTLNALHIL